MLMVMVMPIPHDKVYDFDVHKVDGYEDHEYDDHMMAMMMMKHIMMMMMTKQNMMMMMMTKQIMMVMMMHVLHMMTVCQSDFKYEMN